MLADMLNDRKVTLSTLWVFAVLNYLYADVLGLYDPELLSAMISGNSPVDMTPAFMLVAAILMETAIAMVLLSRLLPRQVNRWANIIVGGLHTLAVAASMFVDTPAMYYAFFGTIEIACTMFIMWYAWRWREPVSESRLTDALQPTRQAGD